MKSAIITGITGQDGSYLAELLLEEGYKVYGVTRRSSTINFHRLETVIDKINLLNADLLDQNSLMQALEIAEPDEIYNLAAQSFVPTSWEQPVLTGEFTALGVTRMLEAMRRICPQSRFYQASSSEMFGKVREVPQTEQTPFYPRSPYGIAKVYGHWITINYRESYNLFASSGILFNHESPRRGYEFVTRKITHNIAKIKKGIIGCFDIGNLEARRDWGYAGDYVRAMWMMLRQHEPDDFVVASGKTRSVREFCEVAFNVAGIRIAWDGKGLNEVGTDRETNKTVVRVNEKYYRPAEVDMLVGNPSKAKNTLKWKPQTTFEQLVTLMVEHDIREIEKQELEDHF
jgi:GDPmannose 4,6-dehydratase